MKSFHPALASLTLVGVVGLGTACEESPTSPDAGLLPAQNISTLSATLRVRCERRSDRSKISVDANNVVPRNGTFRARVRAAGGTRTSAPKRAVGDEVEFDFDSERDDIAAGATPIPANFIQRRDGPDVIGVLLNAQGQVVVRRGVECEFRR
jgi:hypothetical protein